MRGGPAPRLAGAITAAIVLLTTYFAFHRSVPGTRPYTLHGRFASSQGVLPGAPVRIGGVDVGKVVAVRRGPGSTADIAFTLSGGAPPVRADARLRLRPRLFLEGGFYVQLSPGVPAAAPPLRNGATIGLAQTSVTVQYDQILSAFPTRTRAQGATILRELARALGHGGARDARRLAHELPPALSSAAIATDASLGTRADDLSTIVRRSADITATLARNRRELGGFVEDGRRTSEVLAAHDADLRALLSQTGPLLRALPGALTKLDAAVTSTGRLARALRPGLEILPRSLTSTRALLRQLALASRPHALPRLIGSAAPTVRRLPALSHRLVPLLERVGSVSNCAAKRIVPILKSKLDDGRLSSGRPVYEDLLHAATLLASSFQDYDANGPWSRFEGGVSNYVLSTGDIPNVGTLVGGTNLPLLGVRPQWNGVTPPPFRPDALCTAQPLPSLHADVGKAERSVPIARGRGRG
jgi:phospholipid/cholesterol/gamma-HCH transport system substrate-binding protein